MGNVEFNRPFFLRVCYDVSTCAHARFNIGTYNEKKLHLVLKNYFEPNTAYHEVPLSGYVADIYNSEGIIEIQTSGFASMRDKLGAFLKDFPTTIVYPVAQRKWVSWIEPESGEITARNPAPRKGRFTDVIPEMIYIRQFLLHPNLTVRVVLLEIDEYRMLNAQRSRSRKRGSTRYERVPLNICGIYDFRVTQDYIDLLPFAQDAVFTAQDVAGALKLRGRRISAGMRVLEDVRAVERVGKRGRAILYRIANDGNISCTGT